MNDPRQVAGAPAQQQPTLRPPQAPQPNHGAHPHHPQHASPGVGTMPRQGVAPHPPGIGQPRPAPMSVPHAPSAQPQQQGLPRQGAGTTINPAARKPAAADEDAIALVEEEDAPATAAGGVAAAPVSKIKFGAELGHRTHEWKRQLKQGGMGACRVRTFHGKLSDQGLEYVDDAINVWLDGHPEIDIKFVTTNIGMFDGKFKDLALIVNVWY